MSKSNSVKEFMVAKSIENITGRDFVYARQSKKGMSPKSMFYFSDKGEPTLYYGYKPNDTTYFSIPNESFEKIDEETTTVRENFNIKNNLLNMQVTANALLEDAFSSDKLPIHSDILFLKVFAAEPGIDYRYFSYSGTNEIYNYVFNSGPKTPKVEFLLNTKLPKITQAINDDVAALDDANSLPFFNAMMITTPEAEEMEEEESSSCEKPGAGLAESEKEEDKSAEKDTERILEELDGVVTDQMNKNHNSEVFFEEHGGTVTSDKDLYKTVERLAKQLSSKLKGVYGKENCILPTKTLNVRNFVRKSPSYYKRKRDTAKGKKTTMNIIMDCSGSMGGHYIQNGAALCMIINKIAREEKSINGKFILSAGEGSVCVDIATAPETLVDRFRAFSGSEGIENTLTDNIEQLAKGKTNICITDCQITDKAINKAKYEARNIQIEGIYIGEINRGTIKSHEKHMNQYFTRSRILPNIEETVEYLINTVLGT